MKTVKSNDDPENPFKQAEITGAEILNAWMLSGSMDLQVLADLIDAALDKSDDAGRVSERILMLAELAGIKHESAARLIQNEDAEFADYVLSRSIEPAATVTKR